MPASQSDPGLWSGWRVVEHVEDQVEVAGLRLWRSGITAVDPAGHHVTGSAVGQTGSASRRARGELLERAAIITAMHDRDRRLVARGSDGTRRRSLTVAEAFPESPDATRWQYARSNGVALARTWTEACRRGRAEAVERDRVLRSWYGLAPPPVRVAARGIVPKTEGYEWIVGLLPAEAGPGRDLQVAIGLAFPERDELPLLRGFAAAIRADLAIAKAVAECLQGLAFLHDEPPVVKAPACTPTPLFHLDRFLWPGAWTGLREWVTADRGGSCARAARSDDGDWDFVDITPQVAGGTVAVAKAMCRDTLPLAFGEAPCPPDAPRPFGPIHPIP